MSSLLNVKDINLSDIHDMKMEVPKNAMLMLSMAFDKDFKILRSFIRGRVPSKLTGCDDNFACMVSLYKEKFFLE